MNLSEYHGQAEAGCEPNIHKASFIKKRRLFYLNRLHVTPALVGGVVEGQVQAKVLLKIKLCYKGMQ
jgi:hypothetical protein